MAPGWRRAGSRADRVRVPRKSRGRREGPWRWHPSGRTGGDSAGCSAVFAQTFSPPFAGNVGSAGKKKIKKYIYLLAKVTRDFKLFPQCGDGFCDGVTLNLELLRRTASAYGWLGLRDLKPICGRLYVCVQKRALLSGFWNTGKASPGFAGFVEGLRVCSTNQDNPVGSLLIPRKFSKLELCTSRDRCRYR